MILATRTVLIRFALPLECILATKKDNINAHMKAACHKTAMEDLPNTEQQAQSMATYLNVPFENSVKSLETRLAFC